MRYNRCITINISRKMNNDIIATIKLIFAKGVVDGQLNPVHLSTARHGYRIQSQILRIPGRYGFFSPGPQRLQVHQGCFILIFTFCICVCTVLNAFSIFVCRLHGQPNCEKLGLLYASTVIIGVVMIWAVAINGPLRQPGYEWPDWEIRKD